MNYSVTIVRTQKYLVEVTSVNRRNALFQAEALVVEDPLKYETEASTVSVVKNQCGPGYEWVNKHE
jgi:hypothetical protein